MQRLPSVRYATRSEEHTSELQSRENLVCRLLLEKKNQRPRADAQQKQDSNPKRQHKAAAAEGPAPQSIQGKRRVSPRCLGPRDHRTCCDQMQADGGSGDGVAHIRLTCAREYQSSLSTASSAADATGPVAADADRLRPRGWGRRSGRLRPRHARPQPKERWRRVHDCAKGKRPVSRHTRRRTALSPALWFADTIAA